MEEDFQENSTLKTYLPLAAGLLGIVMGLVALGFAVAAANKAGEIKENLAALSKSLEESSNSQKELKALNDKITSAFEQIEATKAAGAINANAVSKQVQNAINALSIEITNNRNLIAKNQEAIGELASRGVRTPKTAAAKPSGKEETSAAATPSPSGKIHKVKAGENFSIIAKKYGVNVSDIEKANPDKDSRRLKIGQEIIIP